MYYYNCIASSDDSVIEKYASDLKQYYRKSRPHPDDCWPPRVAEKDTEIMKIERKKESLKSLCERAELLRYGSVDKIIEEKEPIEYEAMFRHPDSKEGEKYTVLIDGAPGVGKSTLCKRIAKDWANGTVEELKKFKLVILVPLRRCPRAKNISEIFEKISHEETCSSAIDIVKRDLGEGILLMLDGFDELSPELRKDSLFLELITGRRLTNCTLFVTSRPYASQDLKNWETFSRHVEILGFSEDQIKDCIKSAFPEESDKGKADDLIRDLESREDLLSLCYVPMNCAIVIAVYRGEELSLPNTVTELYKMYLTRALERYARKTNLKISRKIRLESLPGDLGERVNALAGIAYKLLINDKFIFSQEDLEASDVAGMELEKMGLVTSFTIEDGYGQTENFQFLHLTIQEFLASWHASQLSPEEQAGIICDFSNSRLKLMRYFLAGITKLQGQNVREAFTQSFKDALRKETQYIDEDVKNCDGTAVLDQLHMIYEAQSTKICQQVSRTFPEETILFEGYRDTGTCTPFLCKVVSFFLSNSSYAWKKVSLNGLHISNTACLQAFHVTGCSSSIQELVLHQHGQRLPEHDSVTGLPLDSFSLIPKIPLFQKVESLSVTLSYPTAYNLCSHIVSILTDLFHLQHLQKLSFLQNERFIFSFKELLSVQVPFSVQAPLSIMALSVPNTLQELHLCLTSSDPRVIEFVGSGLEVSKISNFCFKFSCTDLILNDEAALHRKQVCLEMIALVLPYITKMKHLEYLTLSIPGGQRAHRELTASDDRLKSLHTMLTSTKTLKKLTIDIPDIISSFVDYICDGLKSNSTLSELDITSCHSCDLFSILDSLSIHRMEKISLEYFTSNELMKIWNVILDCNILSECQEISVSRSVKVFRNSDSMKVQKVNIDWSYVDSSDAFEILNSLKDCCQNIKNLKLTFKGVLVSTHTIESKEHLLTEQQDTTQCKIGEMLAYFLLNCECTFDHSAICPNDHSQPLYLDHQMSFVAPYLSYGMSDFPQDSFLIHNKIIYTKYGPELLVRYSVYNMFPDYILCRNQHQSRCNVCSDITMTHCFELHLQPVSELPPQLQCLSPTLSSLQQIVSAQKCVGRITSHAKKCTPIIEKLEMSKYMSEEDHDCWIYIVVDIRVMGSDHVTVQSQLKWIVDVVKIKCPYVKHLSVDIVFMGKEAWEIYPYPEYLRGDEEDLGYVISDIPFLKPQHQNTSQS